MSIYLLDDSLKVDVCFEPGDNEFTDNICLKIEEDCPDEEKIFREDEIHLYLTPQQARQLGMALLAAAEESSGEDLNSG